MLLSIALVLLCGFLFGQIADKIKLPKLIGMLLAGIILGPFVLNALDESLLFISADLRKIALTIILIRAGLSLDITTLKKVGRPALLMCFIPASFEILVTTFVAPKLFGLSIIEAAIMGTVLAAVSPAVIVPRMIKLIESGRGGNKGIPQLILAGASVDDVFVIVLFTSFMNMYRDNTFNILSLSKIPISIIVGIIIGMVLGYIISIILNKYNLNITSSILLIFTISLILVALEPILEQTIAFSGLLAVMALGCILLKTNSDISKTLSASFNKLWFFAEIILFVLVGATVNITYATNSLFTVITLLTISLLFRCLGVLICLYKTDLNFKERIFCVIAYIPKATVQAAIGGLPLAVGMRAGENILTVAVLSIIITAPLGALGIDKLYNKYL